MELAVPYNDSIFDIRHKYSETFACFADSECSAHAKDETENAEVNRPDFSKIYKIKYTANLLPAIGVHMIKCRTTGGYDSVNENVNLMAII
jgi:hypothetical protein